MASGTKPPRLPPSPACPRFQKGGGSLGTTLGDLWERVGFRRWRSAAPSQPDHGHHSNSLLPPERPGEDSASGTFSSDPTLMAPKEGTSQGTLGYQEAPMKKNCKAGGVPGKFRDTQTTRVHSHRRWHRHGTRAHSCAQIQTTHVHDHTH